MSIPEVNKCFLSDSDQQPLVKLYHLYRVTIYYIVANIWFCFFFNFFCLASSPSYCDYDGAINFITILPEYKGRHIILSLKAKYLAQFRHMTQAVSSRALWGDYYRVRGYDLSSFQIQAIQIL